MNIIENLLIKLILLILKIFLSFIFIYFYVKYSLTFTIEQQNFVDLLNLESLNNNLNNLDLDLEHLLFKNYFLKILTISCSSLNILHSL
jgi:hypothetical protein